MLKIIVAHRGCGKTTLLGSLTESGQLQKFNFEWIDLDLAIEQSYSTTILQIFSSFGEAKFREFERNEFNKIVNQSNVKNIILTVGAGFPLSAIPDGIEVILLSRASDANGRIFLDRPRLRADLDPVEESKALFQNRQGGFALRANKIIDLPEGLPDKISIFADLIFTNPKIENAIITINSNSKADLNSFEMYELRNDLLDNLEIESFFEKIERKKILLSIRNRNFKESWLPNVDALDIDASYSEFFKYFDMNLFGLKIISSHKDSIEHGLAELSKYETLDIHEKLCPLVQTWSDLEKGHNWWLQKPQTRSFLPRSENGRWAWYRLFMKAKQKINFARIGEGSAKDQPTLWEWLVTPIQPKKIAAVLGSPVDHSRSPSFHQKFFADFQTPFFKIDVSESEWASAISFLKKLGLIAAAVTSPLKKKAYLECAVRSSLSAEVEAVNTLALDTKLNQWIGANTDILGFSSIFAADYQGKNIVIWGGGGTLQMVQKCFPQAVAYSSRTGLPRYADQADLIPEIIIWAVPRTLDFRWPADSWKPSLVIDLNYAENSLGLEYAQRKNIKYISGIEFFEAQARAQQQFWKEHL